MMTRIIKQIEAVLLRLWIIVLIVLSPAVSLSRGIPVTGCTSAQAPGTTGKTETGTCSPQDPAIRQLIQEELLLEAANFLKSAIDKNKEIVKVCPKAFDAMNTIAGLHGKLGEFEEEMVWAKKAISINPQFWPAYINYGNALAALGKPGKAKEAYEKAAQLAPKEPLGVYSLGVLEEDQGNFRKALGYYQKSVQIDPKFESGYFNLAAMYANLKRFDEAIASLKKVLELNPNAKDARAMLLQIEKDKKER